MACKGFTHVSSTRRLRTAHRPAAFPASCAGSTRGVSNPQRPFSGTAQDLRSDEDGHSRGCRLRRTLSGKNDDKRAWRYQCNYSGRQRSRRGSSKHSGASGCRKSGIRCNVRIDSFLSLPCRTICLQDLSFVYSAKSNASLISDAPSG